MKYRKDIINSVLDKDFDNIIDALDVVKAITEKLQKEKFVKLLQTLKRIANIVKNNKTKEVNEKLFQNEYEKTLYVSAKDLAVEIQEILKNKEYSEYFDKWLWMKITKLNKTESIN